MRTLMTIVSKPGFENNLTVFELRNSFFVKKFKTIKKIIKKAIKL